MTTRACVNRCTFVGDIDRVPQLLTGEHGEKLAVFDLLVTRRWRDGAGERRTARERHRCIASNVGGSRLADIVERHAERWSRVYVEGALGFDEQGAPRLYLVTFFLLTAGGSPPPA